MINREEISKTDILYKYIDGDEEVGFLEIRLVDGVLDIMDLVVKETHRKRGIGTALMNEIINKENYSKIMLEVNENNKDAIRLYSKLGFEEISIRERYYSDSSAIIMVKYKERN